MSLVSRATPTERVGDRGLAIDRGDGEAGGIEMVRAQQRGGTHAVDPAAAGADRIDDGGDGERATTGDACEVAAGDARERRGATGREVDHPTAGRMPWRRVVALDVRVKRVRQEGAMQLDEIDRRRGLPERVLAGVVARLQGNIFRVHPRIERGKP